MKGRTKNRITMDPVIVIFKEFKKCLDLREW